MKKLLCIISLLLMLCAPALGEVAVNEENFPDATFRNYLRTKIDTDEDGNLSDAEIRAVTSLSLSAANFKGIEYFTYLSSLTCHSIALTALDLSRNTLLQTLDCSNCRLTSLNLRKNTALKVLNCSNNLYITSLDLSNNPALITVDCYNNRLSKLDISRCTGLTTLNCYSNNLDSLSTSNNLVLATIDCRNNHILSMDLSRNLMLTSLNVSNNYLRELDVSSNRNLKTLGCVANFLTKLNLTNNTALTGLQGYNNRISELDLSKTAITGSLTIIQQIRGAGLTDNGDGTYSFDFKSIVASGNIPKITGLNSSIYNSTAGVITFNSYTNSVNYAYNTGRSNVTMGVTVLFDPYADMAPVIATSALDYGKVGISYSLALQAVGAASTLCSVSEGTLPNGIGLSPNGTLQGMPTKSGSYTFTVKAENPKGSDTKTYTLVIDPNSSVPDDDDSGGGSGGGGDSGDDDDSDPLGSSTAPTITTSFLPDFKAGVTYSYKLEAEGDSPITWLITNGTLPSGLNLSTSGVISGAASETGIFSFTVEASNSAGRDSASFMMNVTDGLQTLTVPPAIAASAVPNAVLSMDYSATLIATGTTPITWNMTNGSVPGLTLSPSGVLTGIPEAAGTYAFTVQASNSAGTDSRTLTITITESSLVTPPLITTSSLTAGAVSVDYGFTLKAAGVRPLSWALVSGDIPGLSLNASGLLQLSCRPKTWQA